MSISTTNNRQNMHEPLQRGDIVDRTNQDNNNPSSLWGKVKFFASQHPKITNTALVALGSFTVWALSDSIQWEMVNNYSDLDQHCAVIQFQQFKNNQPFQFSYLDCLRLAKSVLDIHWGDNCANLHKYTYSDICDSDLQLDYANSRTATFFINWLSSASMWCPHYELEDCYTVVMSC